MSSDDAKLGLDDVKISELKEAFSLFDQATSADEGCITPEKLGVVMSSLEPDLKPTPEELKDLIMEVDSSKEGKLEFKDFLGMMAKSMEENDPLEEVRAAFKVFDHNMNGHISADELQHVMKQLGEVLTDQEVQAMIMQADKRGEGNIDFDEFKVLMESNDAN